MVIPWPKRGVLWLLVSGKIMKFSAFVPIEEYSAVDKLLLFKEPGRGGFYVLEKTNENEYTQSEKGAQEKEKLRITKGERSPLWT